MNAMLHKSHKPCCVVAPTPQSLKRMVAWTAGVVLWATAAQAAFSDPLANPATVGAPAVPALTQPATAAATSPVSIAGQAPAPASAMRAFELLRSALDDARPLAAIEDVRGPGTATGADARADGESTAMGLFPIHGASIQIRLHGRVIGAASRLAIQRLTRDDESHALVRDAFNEALAEALASLRLPNDATRDEVAKSLTREMTLSVEVAGLAVPIEPATWAELAQRVNPGVTGLASRVGPNDEPRALFPSDVLSKGATTLAALSGQIAQQIGEGGAAAVLDELNVLREKRSLRLFTFASTHVAQGLPRSSPVFLLRGSRLVDRQSVTLASLREWTTHAGEHLIARSESMLNATRDKPTGLGTIKPWLEQGGSAAQQASSGEVLLAAIALRRAAGLAEIDHRWRAKAQAAADRLINHVCAAPVAERQAWDAPTCALLVVALDQMGAHEQREARIEAAARVWAAFTETPSVTTAPGFDRSLPESARGLVALALVIEAERSINAAEKTVPASAASEKGDPLALARSAVRAAFADTPPERLVGQMPWLLWAEQRLARLERNRKLEADRPASTPSSPSSTSSTSPAPVVFTPLPSAVALRSVRDVCWQFQFDARDAQAETLDLVGGIVFTSSGGGGGGGRVTPLPTWNTARAGAFLAAALREPSITDASERLVQVARLLKLAAFLRQLQVDEHSAWACVSPGDGGRGGGAIGGVRASTWDHQMPPDATSFTLLTYAELIESITSLSVGARGEDTQGE